MPDRVGQQIGNYRLVRPLGSGGFAEVYLGQHVRLASKQAAIKILHLFDVDAQKFQQEAEITEQLVHPHIVRLLDFDLQQGTPFLVLDYAPGGSLRTRYPKGSQIPLATVVQYLKEIAPALQYAHDQHILHRDIKPDNMLVGRQGELVLSDFGIAELSQTGRTSLQASYGIGGTPFYMAPEMFRGKPEKASDQYALAVVVYEWLCGTVPFSEGNFIQLGYQHTHEPVPPLRDKNSAIPPAVEQVVMKALSKDPTDRFHSISDFAEALEKASKYPGLMFLYRYELQETALPLRVLWSADGQYIATLCQNTVHIFEAQSGKRVLALTHGLEIDGYMFISWTYEAKGRTLSSNTITLAEGSGFKWYLRDTSANTDILWMYDDGDHLIFQGIFVPDSSRKEVRSAWFLESLISLTQSKVNVSELKDSFDSYRGKFDLSPSMENKIIRCVDFFSFICLWSPDSQYIAIPKGQSIEVYKALVSTGEN